MNRTQTSPLPRRSWNFYSAGRIIFGAGSIRHLTSVVQRMKGKNIVLITDQNLIRAGVLQSIELALSKTGVAWSMFDGGCPEPSLEVAYRAIEFARSVSPDLIIGVGGGSNLDLAKITSTILAHGGVPNDYFGFDRIPGPIVPLICIPTTSGTGSEVSHAAVLTDTEQNIKVSTLSPYLRPSVALVDSELTFTCPPRATADSGLDALTHSIEAYTARNTEDLDWPVDEAFPYDGKQPIGSLFAEKAIALIGEHLVTTYREPGNAVARDGMALASIMGGLAFSNNAVALVHALEYPIGAVLHCSHGAGNALLLPHVMRYNLPDRLPEFARIARLLGKPDVPGGLRATAEQSIEAVESMLVQLEIPRRLRDLGGKEEQLPEFARKAHQIQRLMLLNPRYPSENDLLEILRAAF